MSHTERKLLFLSVSLTGILLTKSNNAQTQQSISLSESDNNLFSMHQNPESWYSKTLELTMHVWADLDMLQREAHTLLPDHIELIFNASLGKMIHLHWCLQQLKKASNAETSEFDHLTRIMHALEKLCIKIMQQPILLHRSESTQGVLRSIMANI